MDIGGLGGRKGGVSGCNRMDFSLTETRGSSSQEVGSFRTLGVTFHSMRGIPSERGFRKIKDSLGLRVTLCQQGVLPKEIGGECPRLVKAASMEVYDPRQAVSCHVSVCSFCEAHIWRQL